MVRQEELKTMPFGDVWNEYCIRCGTSEEGWFDEVKRYEADILSSRK
jgi:L-rhamnose isomerase